MTNDPDAGLSPYERTSQATHRAVDNIARAWPLAVEDADARGYPAAVMQPSTGGTAELTSVEAAALKPSRAVAWLAELYDVQQLIFTSRYGTGYVLYQPETFRIQAHAYAKHMLEHWMPHTEQAIRRTINLSNKASLWWPPTPVSGKTVDGVTVGQRGNTVESCGLCGDPIPDKIKRIDGQAFHATSCYYQVWRQRRRIA